MIGINVVQFFSFTDVLKRENVALPFQVVRFVWTYTETRQRPQTRRGRGQRRAQ